MDSKVGYKFIHHLEWDSSFFGYKVGTVTLPTVIQDELEYILQKAQKNNYSLIYLFLDAPIESNILNSYRNIYFLDEKVTYIQKADFQSKYLTEISLSLKEINCKDPSVELINLALQSGEYSRFKIDKNISEKKFTDLYTIWLKNSLLKNFADEVWAWEESNKILGLITLSKKANRADIGLIAVDRSSRGKGIGKTMVKKALQFTSDKGLELLQVVTQKQNIRACQFYEANGFSEEKVKYVYHIWR